MNPTERISHELGNDDAWICICGNTPDQDGFFPCNARGDEVKPTAEAWTTNWYVCNGCGRMIDQHTLIIVGRTDRAAQSNESAV
jgi:YD repeat-containing protein